MLSFIQISGVREYEISIEIDQDTLRSYGLSLPQIAQIIGANSLDLPGGDIDTGERQTLLRVEGEGLTGRDYADIILIGTEAGAQIRLGDIARIEDGFRDTGLITRYNSQPAALIEIFRTGDEQVLQIADTVQRYLKRLRQDLPAGVTAEIWRSDAEQFRSRRKLRLTNGAIGAVLVLVALGLFLRLRVAFWVAVGIVVSFVGTLAVMNFFGLSINQLSMFGFILALGIVVDDAIIVGENIHAEQESSGADGMTAAIKGAQRVALPVIFAVSTTIIAFSPLLNLPGNIGKLLTDIPVVVISVLILSVVESLLILPHHLSGMGEAKAPKSRVMRWVMAVKDWFDRQLKAFVNGPLDRAARFSTHHYGVVLAGFLAAFILTGGLFAGGYLRFVFFPDIQGDIVTAQFAMPVGTTEEETLKLAQRLVQGGTQAAHRLVEERGEQGMDTSAAAGNAPLGAPGNRLIKAVYVSVGRQAQAGGPNQGSGSGFVTPSSGSVRFKLSDPNRRQISAKDFADAWRRAIGRVPTADYVSFSASLVGVGSPVSVELSHPDGAVLNRLVERVKSKLQTVNGVYDIYDTQEECQQELQLRQLDQARSSDLSLQQVANQVRAAFFGAEALRVQRGREEVRVYVRLPDQERDSIADIYDYRIRAGADTRIPLGEVAQVSFDAGPSSINRRNGRRIITVNGNVHVGISTGQEVTALLQAGLLPELKQEYPDMQYSFAGAQREQQRTLPALFQSFALALFAIYTLLAVSFRSYVQPFIILLVIPFGLIGAALGHLILGIDVTFLSLFGLVGLTGVVVNDALILLDFANARRLAGEPMAQAVIAATKSRFRPILLTSVTTFLGVAPIVFSQSVQAKFLVPMAASIAFGILFASILQMLLVPALTQAQFDGQRWVADRFFGKRDVAVVRGAPGGGAG